LQALRQLAGTADKGNTAVKLKIFGTITQKKAINLPHLFSPPTGPPPFKAEEIYSPSPGGRDPGRGIKWRLHFYGLSIRKYSDGKISLKSPNLLKKHCNTYKKKTGEGVLGAGPKNLTESKIKIQSSRISNAVFRILYFSY
jgi:hypothetical protein